MGKGHHGSYRTGQSQAVDAQTKGFDSKASKGQNSKGNKKISLLVTDESPDEAMRRIRQFELEMDISCQ